MEGYTLSIINIWNVRNSIRYEYGLNFSYIPRPHEVGLYQESDSGMVLIKKVEADINSQFSFSALTGGVYRVAAVIGNLVDIKTDFRSKGYSILREDITLDSDNMKSDVFLFPSPPIHQYEILSINFINEYWVNYTIAPPQSTIIREKKGVFSEDNEFYNWISEIALNTVTRVTVVIRLLDEEGNPAVTWTLQNAFPLKVTPTDMNSTGSEAAVETIVFSHEGMVASVD